MSEPKFTKGPWRVFASDEIFSDEGQVAYMSDDLPVPDTVANAHLIAAAPDIYAALDALVLCINSGSTVTYGCLNDAKRALSRARGEA